MTTSILDVEELRRNISGEKGVPPIIQSNSGALEESISGQDLIDRVKELFTPETAEALARLIEEGREQVYD